MTFPHTATIRALNKVGTKYTYANESTSSCFLQPLDNSSSQIFGVAFGKGYNCYFPYATAIDSKKEVVIDGVTYGCRGVMEHNYGNLKHKRALLERMT